MVKIGKADEEALYRAADPLQKAVLQGAEKEDRYEYEGLFEGGSEGPLWLRIGASVERRNSWGKALRIVGAMWDETVVKQAQQALMRARDLAQEAVRTKAAFLANMSHEMRTPLSAVVGLSELLRQQKLEREAAELVDLIQTSGKGLTDLVNDILELSRIEAGRMLLHAVAASIEGCCKDAVSLLTHPGDAAGVVGLPGAVKVDPNRLRQVLLNLLGNAIKFTEKGEIFGRAGWEAGRAKLSVIDTGTGIAEEHQAVLFRPFTQVDTPASRLHGGAELGLSICRKVVEEQEERSGSGACWGKGRNSGSRSRRNQSRRRRGAGRRRDGARVQGESICGCWWWRTTG